MKASTPKKARRVSQGLDRTSTGHLLAVGRYQRISPSVQENDGHTTKDQHQGDAAQCTGCLSTNRDPAHFADGSSADLDTHSVRPTQLPAPNRQKARE